MKIKRRHLRKLANTTSKVLIKGAPVALDIAMVVVPGAPMVTVAAKAGKVLLRKRR